jgi:hypothetical protein
MKIVVYTVLVLLVLSELKGTAQENIPLIDPILIRFKGRIISAADSSALPYVNIVNNRTHTGTITNTNGYFTIEMLNIDSLHLSSVGYQQKVITVPQNYNEQDIITFVMNPVNYLVGEVEIKGDKPTVGGDLGTGKPVDLPPELRGDAFNEKPSVLSALTNPVSYWQYYLSRKEREKRKVREAMMIEKNWEMHSQNYNKEMVMKLTDLNESEADSFMVWFNSQNILPYTASEYEVRTSIIYYYKIYRKEKNSPGAAK